MDTPQNRKEKKTQGFSFFFDFIKSMTTSVFKKENSQDEPETDNPAGTRPSSISVSDFVRMSRRAIDDGPIAGLLDAFDALYSDGTRRSFADFIAQTEAAASDVISDALLTLESETQEEKRKIEFSIGMLSALDTERILNEVIDTEITGVSTALLIADATERRFRTISDQTGEDFSDQFELVKGLKARLRWLIASEERIVAYIIKGLGQCGNPKLRLNCLNSIRPYVSSKITDPRLKTATEDFLGHLKKYYETEIKGFDKPVISAKPSDDEELPEFGNEEEDLLARFGNSDGNEDAEEDIEATERSVAANEGAEDYTEDTAQELAANEEHMDYPQDDGAGESETDGDSDFSVATESVSQEKAIPARTGTRKSVKNVSIRQIDAEIGRIPSLDERIVTISFWIKNRYFGDDEECSEYLALKLESLENTRARNGGLLADLFYNMRQIQTKEAQLEMLEAKLNSPEYIHVRQTISTIIGNIKADMDFLSPSVTEDTLEKIVDDEEDLSKKLANLYAMRYDDALSPFREFVEERIEELETHKTAETWEKLEDDYYGKAMEKAQVDLTETAGSFVTHDNIITLVRAMKKLPDKVERKKFIKEQELRKPLPEDNTFHKQRRLLFHLMSAEIMDKPESMLKALADRVLLGFKDKKELLEVLKKSRFTANGKSISLQAELGIKDEQVSYSAAYIVGCELPFVEKRIKHLELFRQGSLPLPQVTYKNASGGEAKANYRDFFAITHPIIDSVIEYLSKFVEGKKSEARMRISAEKNKAEVRASVEDDNAEEPDPLEAVLANDESFETGASAESEFPQADDGAGYDPGEEQIREPESESEQIEEMAVVEESDPFVADEDFTTELGEITDEIAETGGNLSDSIGYEDSDVDTSDGLSRISIDSIDSIGSAETADTSHENKIEQRKPLETPMPEKSEETEDSGTEPNDIESDVRYTSNRAQINGTVLGQIKDKGAAASRKESESVKRDTEKKVEEKAQIAEEKIAALLVRLSLCFPEAVPELITGSIIPIFVSKSEYIMRDVFTAFNQNIFIPVLYEGTQVDVHKVIASLQSFLNLASLASRCEKTLVIIAKRLKKVRGNYIRAQVKAIAVKAPAGNPNDQVESICQVLLGLDRKVNAPDYLAEKYIAACEGTDEGKALRLKLTNLKNVLRSEKTIDWPKVTSYFGKTVSDLIAQIRTRAEGSESYVFSLDEDESGTGSQAREAREFTDITMDNIDEIPDNIRERAGKSGEEESESPVLKSASKAENPVPEKSAEGKKPAGTEKKVGDAGKKNEQNHLVKQTQPAKAKDTQVQSAGKAQVQKKTQKKSFMEQIMANTKKEKPRETPSQKNKHAPEKRVAKQPAFVPNKRQGEFLANAKELITDKLLFLIKEYTSIAMLDMLYKSYLSPKSKKKTMLALINQDKHKAIYNAIAFDEHTIEMLGFDRQKVIGAFEKKKRKLLS